MQLLRPGPLVTPLAQQQLGGKEQARYLLASFLVFIVPGYAGLMPSTGAGYTWALAFEAWFYVAIAVLGVLACRDAAGGDGNKNFVTEFTCLYVPVAVSTLVTVWGCYWLAIWLLGEKLAEWSWSHVQFMVNLRALSTDLFGLLTFVAHVTANSIIYIRLVGWLRKVRAAR